MKTDKVEKLDDLFELRSIKGKRIFIVDDHHKALAAWAVIRREEKNAPILITFDHHTDTIEAYNNVSAVRHPYDDAARERYQAELQGKLGWATDADVLSSVADLKHDEHIDAAAICGILKASFSIQLDDMGGHQSIEERAYYDELREHWPHSAGRREPVRPFTYEAPEHNVFVVGHECFIGCRASPHNDACLPLHYSQVLESVYVDDQLTRAGEMARCIGIENGVESVPYILDVDLDVFHTIAAIEPGDPQSFYRLIRHALAITIATEEQCVEELWWKGEAAGLTAKQLLARMCNHIEQALS